MEPTLVVLLYASIAAAAAPLGALPLVGRPQLPRAAIGWANALASGAMLGVAYALMSQGLDLGAAVGAAGAVLGIVFVFWTHVASGTEDLDLNRLEDTSPEYGYKVLLVTGLHSASEGVAIGAAMAVSLPFGIFTAIAMALHNIPEATVLCAIFRSRGTPLASAAGLSVVSDVSQVMMAVVTFALVAAAPSLLPWALGFAFGSLIYLTMAELLPESYREAGHTTIALVTIVAMGIVVLLGGVGL